MDSRTLNLWRHIGTAVMVVGVIAPVHATEATWPALLNVTNITAPEVLNIREAPNPRTPVIGTLLADATGIEVIRTSDNGSWGLINSGETSGWVYLAYLERSSDNTPRQIGPAIRHCFGTEPFWSLAIDPPRITYSTPDIAERVGLLSSYYASRSRPDRYAELGSFFTGPWGDRDIHLSIRRETCSDGMSDREYGVSVDMLIRETGSEGDGSGTGLFSGCCSLSPLSAE